MMVLVVLPSDAEMTVKAYKELAQKSPRPELLGIYVAGLGDGLVWANAWLHGKRGKQTRLFCQPEKLRLNAENYTGMIDHRIEKLATSTPQADLEEKPIGLILLQELTETFPCEVDGKQ